ncbi:MAG: aminotransferase class V-fold PLP-dependent enzyme [Bacteroidetes Order II. Incertae sedis bacterium]|jgi:isopenicillin-N epimerase|nr:aminotransferase class V-fold PLP-dependent enzyme [Bacteroidetes Order II. bacterium]MDG1754822.1 aminotransferase class V-fold PLP-dependent enzyme [Rhodothermales bacterium]HAY37697.1 aminotransferase V [Bacteroidota bacterium]MBT4603683.1 aminotransferase class V-fold PLP-dependent enzyme [Bacteroidetes Order II. bacterium]MBT5248563.1 aminotransferase class V-fold PLP-dependent enzyme [Bacteroidetes Order II. bacterium]
MYSRRKFLGTLGLPAAASMMATTFNPASIPGYFEMLANKSGTPDQIAQDEDFWHEIQQAFTVDRSLVNLNNGGVSPAPAIVQQAMKAHLDYMNQAPVYTMWRILQPQAEGVRQRLAREFGASAEEIALTRNASEGLQICQNGFDFEPGDEVLTTTQDYGRMINTFKQRERRDGIVLKQFSIPIPAEDPDEIVRLFEANITPKTKAILMCHIINITGQILPVKGVVQMARKRGIPVIVDGAHSFAHFAFKQEDLDCDYFATSLHKWLLAPIGTGMLYVRKNKIKDLWPMQAATEARDEDIRKFEEIGTHPEANQIAISEALTFHQGIGAENKEARLRYLRDYWANRLLEHDRIYLNTSQDPRFSCCIGNVGIRGIDTTLVGKYMWDEHRIIITPIKHKEFEGARVTANVYTTIEELERFCDAMEYLANNGLPAKYLPAD